MGFDLEELDYLKEGIRIGLFDPKKLEIVGERHDPQHSL
jgi:hypothetical protein